MRKFAIIATSALALSVAPVALGHDQAQALDAGDIIRGLVVMGVAAAIVNAVGANQYHCHPGYGCHRHGAAGPYHYHAGPRIVYHRAPPPVYAPPPPPPVYAPAPAPVYGGYSQAHYNWCAAKYRSYHAGSNTYQPYGPYPRRQCVSPYM